MKAFRRYVRNRFRPEGGMVEGWSTEEAIEFCTYYLTSKGSEFHNLITREDYVAKERLGRNLL
jgi:hypothetical protein